LLPPMLKREKPYAAGAPAIIHMPMVINPTIKLFKACLGIPALITAFQFSKVGVKLKSNGWLIAAASLRDARIVQKYGKITISKNKLNMINVIIALIFLRVEALIVTQPPHVEHRII